jgi:hypothetical protein
MIKIVRPLRKLVESCSYYSDRTKSLKRKIRSLSLRHEELTKNGMHDKAVECLRIKAQNERDLQNIDQILDTTVVSIVLVDFDFDL